MRKDAQAVLLLLVGATLLKISFAGTYVRYVKAGLLPLLIVTGLVLVAVAGVTLWQHLQVLREAEDGSHRAAPSTPAETADDDHGHDHEKSRVAWLLLVPALALLVFAPPALGSFQADRNGTAVGTQAGSDFAPLPPGDPLRITLLDYAARAVFDDGQSLAGRQFLLTGFVIAGPNGQPYLARMVVGCCAADGRPVKVGLTGDIPATIPTDQWLEVTGTYTDRADRDSVNAELIPYLQVTSVRDVAAPEQQYE